MKTSLTCPWARQVHQYLRDGETKWGKPFGMTLEELEQVLGPSPFGRRLAGNLLARMARKGWLEAKREPAHAGSFGGSQVRVRYSARFEMPREAKPKASSYFDGLVRVSSVFELGGALSRQGAQL